MRLLFAIKTLTLPGGGAERVVAEVTRGLAARGHDLILASFDPPGAEPFYPIDRPVRHVALGIGDVGRRTGPGEALRRIAALRRLAREARPDVAVGFMHSIYIPFGLALLGTDVPMVASEHITYAHHSRRPLQAALLRLTPWLAGAATAISPAIRDGFPAPLRRIMTIVPNPVRIAAGPGTDVAGEGRPVKTLLAVGRLEAQKDHAVLVDAFARIAGDFPDWRLRIVGEGVLRPQLRAQALRLGLGDRVELPGATRAVGEEYAAAQLFAMPSSYESFGLTAAEALGRGLPVVGFADCPGVNELVRDGVNGALAEGPDRPEALARALRPLMTSTEQRRALAAAAPASVEAFAPERIYDVWEALLGRIASGGSPE